MFLPAFYLQSLDLCPTQTSTQEDVEDSFAFQCRKSRCLEAGIRRVDRHIGLILACWTTAVCSRNPPASEAGLERFSSTYFISAIATVLNQRKDAFASNTTTPVATVRILPRCQERSMTPFKLYVKL